MRYSQKSFILGIFLAPIVLSPLQAQTARNTPAASANAAPPDRTATSAGQAPEDVLARLSGLIHTGKYAEAQQLTAGLLLAYPTTSG